jgi:metallo-beta-lactamase superfamily protein
MIFRQLVHDDLGCASYVIGDEDAGVAAVVDPRLDIDAYLELARYVGVTIEHVLETHTHADHVSGHGRLAAATGATIHVHRLAAAGYDHEPFEDGWQLALGDVSVEALHTPGHRPEHTAFLLRDTSRGEEPWAVLSGDSPSRRTFAASSRSTGEPWAAGPLRPRRSARARWTSAGRRAPWWSTSAPTSSSTTRTSPGRCASACFTPASAPSWPGWARRRTRSCSSAATTPTRGWQRSWLRRWGSPLRPACSQEV